MEQVYKNKINNLGYTQLVCDIFSNWEDVKDELLIPERKTGTGNGTIHVYLSGVDKEMRSEFPLYYSAVEAGNNPDESAIEITHFFLPNNIISMLGHVCKYCYDKKLKIDEHVINILDLLPHEIGDEGLLCTTSLFKLSKSGKQWRPYFKQFEQNGVFAKVVRKVLLPNSTYKISLYKNERNEYAAFWLIGFKGFSDFEAVSDKSYLKSCNKSELQVIYYGAPGTGKSNTIKGLTNKDNSQRITFHPDSDYASFVGCYKPTVEPIKCGAYKELEELKEEAKTINESPDEKVAQVIAFVTKYANDLQHVVETNPEVGSLQNLLKTYLGFNSNTYLAYVVDYVLKNQKKEITYKFCPQAFTEAYVKAWKDTSKPYYLVIEEINRGNCAQIFGDIFQLLDRGDDGNSSYEITPDKDLQQYLAEKFENEEIVDKDIKDGVKMRLPSNLYILATMNTSDQSLFPIDSAFKRRWDWKYIPIKNEGKNHKIVVGRATYDWWGFIDFVNDRIERVTDSEDKQIGYWFAKANDKNQISAETLVSKVLFYLWNDVFKDYTHNTNSLFKTDKRKYKFREFYLENGDVNIGLLNQFLLELGLKNETPQSEETQSAEE